MTIKEMMASLPLDQALILHAAFHVANSRWTPVETAQFGEMARRGVEEAVRSCTCDQSGPCTDPNHL